MCVCSIHSGLRFSAPFLVQISSAKPRFSCLNLSETDSNNCFVPKKYCSQEMEGHQIQFLSMVISIQPYLAPKIALKSKTKQPMIGAELQKAALKPPSKNCCMLCGFVLQFPAQVTQSITNPNTQCCNSQPRVRLLQHILHKEQEFGSKIYRALDEFQPTAYSSRTSLRKAASMKSRLHKKWVFAGPAGQR